MEYDVRSSAGWIFDRHASLGTVTEIRVLRHTESGEKSIWAGLYGPEDLNALQASLQPVGPTPRKRIPPNDHARIGEANFYFTLQGVNPDRVTGPRGVLRRARETVRDTDISVYTLFPIDIDPVRPRGVSATDEEKAAALEVADTVAQWLLEKGAPPIRADSGNGYHLLVPLRPFRDAEVIGAAHDAQLLLRLLDARFSTPQARVDIGNFNPSRIFKLYGTMAVKGSDSPDRPHRLASIDLSHTPPDSDLFAMLRDELDAFKAQVHLHRLARNPAVAPSAASTHARQIAPPPSHSGAGASLNPWRAWRDQALAILSLDAAYGPFLTGVARDGWLECRDPSSSSGDRNPSAGVADGGGVAERGTFHSFRTGESMSLFDFLIQHGMASDFRSACAWVADHAGVPMPGSPEDVPESLTSGFDLAQLPRLMAVVSAEFDPSRRLAHIRALLYRLASIPSLEQNLALLEVQRATGIAVSVLRRSLTDQRRERRGRTPENLSKGLPVLDVIRGEDTLSTVFQRLIDLILPLERFYVRGGSLAFVQQRSSPLAVTESNLPGLLSAGLEVRMLQRVEGRVEVVGYEPLPVPLARTFVNNPRVRELLPPLSIWCQAPFFATDWTFISRKGYYPVDGGIYYDGPELSPRPGCTSALDTLLHGTPWATPIDRINFLGALLTGLTMAHWTTGHPVLAINANREGSGKSTLAQALGLVMEGRKTPSITFDPVEAEFEKQIATRVDLGERFICVDNVKLRRPVESAVLERTVTDYSPNFRRLGSNTSITREQNDLLFCLTMNNTLLGADMRVRSLPINLHLEGPSRRAEGALRDPKRWLLDHWRDLVAEVAGMVQVWLDAGRPAGSGRVRHNTGNTWAATIDAILRANGHQGFLSNYEASMYSYDKDYLLMIEVCREHRQLGEKTAAEWAQVLATGPLEERFRDGWGKPKSGHAQTIIVTRLFQAFLKAGYEVDGQRYRLVRREPRGATHSPLYRFEAEPELEAESWIDSMDSVAHQPTGDDGTFMSDSV